LPFFVPATSASPFFSSSFAAAFDPFFLPIFWVGFVVPPSLSAVSAFAAASSVSFAATFASSSFFLACFIASAALLASIILSVAC